MENKRTSKKRKKTLLTGGSGSKPSGYYKYHLL
jgi:hypothetical protein